jgi:hypothetical protein
MLAKTGGELVVFLDDDVNVEPDYLRTMVNMWREGHIIGFAQIELEDMDGGIRKIPERRELVGSVGHVDTLCGFVDSAIAKGFFWDLFDEHDARYFQQILSFTRGAFGWTEKLIGRNKRNFSRGIEDKEPEIMDIVRQLSRAVRKATPEIESLIVTDYQATLNYVMNALQGKRWIPGESIIAQNTNAAMFYLTNVLLGRRYELAESLFSKDINTAIAYSKITKLKWKDIGRSDVEEMIERDPRRLKEYQKIT